MKRLLIFLLLFFVLASYSQVTNTESVRVTNATTQFGKNIPAGTLVYDVDGEDLFIAEESVASNQTLTTASTSFRLINNFSGYPSAGIALSTGSAWGTSITNNSSNWNTTYDWGYTACIIQNQSATSIFQYPHSSIVVNDKLFLGERKADPYIVRFNDPDDLTNYDRQAISGTGSSSGGLEAVCYDETNGKLYFSVQDAPSGALKIVEVDPDNLSGYSIHTISGLSTYYTPPICTDGSYIYGATAVSSGTILFKISLSTWTVTSTSDWTNGYHAHACQINTSRSEFYITNSGAGTMYMAKVSTSDLSHSDVNISSYVAYGTDDIAFYDDGTTCNVFIVGESKVGNYGGVMVTTTDGNSLTGIDLKPSYGLFKFDNVIYVCGSQGYVQAFSVFNPTDVSTFILDKLVPTEILKTSSGQTFVTDWKAASSCRLYEFHIPILSEYGITYPDAGIPISTGSDWGTSITDNSNNWNTAYGWGDHSQEGYINNNLYAKIRNISSVGSYQMPHSSLMIGDNIYIGERINNSTPSEIARIIKYDKNTLDELDAYDVGANLDVETMCYDESNNRIYATRYSPDYYLEILSINPTTMSLDGSVHIYSSISAGTSPTIVTDGSYIYGGTCTTPVTLFKIRISDWTLIDTETWTNGSKAHASRIDITNGYMYISCIPTLESTHPYFGKVSLSDISSYTEVDIGNYVRKASDDFAMINTGSEVYCFIGSEYIYSTGENSEWGGVRIKTSDLSLEGIVLKETLGLHEYKNIIYSVTKDGYIQAFNGFDLDNVATYNLNGYQGEDILTDSDGRVFVANMNNYTESDGKLSELYLLGNGYELDPSASGGGDMLKSVYDIDDDGDIDVAAGGTNIDWYAVGDILIASGNQTLSKLSAGTSGYVLTSNGAGSAPSWQAAGGGSTTFIGLTDTPGSYSGQAGKWLKVNAGATALEFTDAPSGGGVTSVAAGNGMDFTTITSSGSVTLGTPSSITTSSTNSLTTTSHTHALDLSGRSVLTQYSLTGGGNLGSNRTLNLVGDVASPGNSKYYGTNSGGTRGFYDLPSGGGANVTVQTLSGLTPSWDMGNGINAKITLSGNTTITLSNVPSGYSGNLTVTNIATAYTITFSGYTMKISPYLDSSSGAITMSGGSKVDELSWYYDGTYVIINGQFGYD